MPMLCAPLATALLSVFATGPQEAAPSKPENVVAVEALRHVAARELAPAVQARVGNQVRVQVDPRTQSLLLAGSAQAVEHAQVLVRALDRSREGAAGSADDLFPPAEYDLSLDASEPQGQGIRLIDLCEAYARATGQRLVLQQLDRNMLEGTILQPAQSGSLTIGASEMQAFFENALAQNGFALVPLGGEQPRLLGVVSRQANQRSILRERAVLLGTDRIELAARHPAVTFTTIVELGASNANTVAQPLFRLITDNQSQIVAPVGNTVVLSGPGPWVYALQQALVAEERIATAQTQGERVVHELLPLAHSQADALVHVVTEALEASQRLRRSTLQLQQAQMPGMVQGSASARVQAGPGNKALLVTCLASQLDEIRTLVALLDRG